MYIYIERYLHVLCIYIYIYIYICMYYYSNGVGTDGVAAFSFFFVVQRGFLGIPPFTYLDLPKSAS